MEQIIPMGPLYFMIKEPISIPSCYHRATEVVKELKLPTSYLIPLGSNDFMISLSIGFASSRPLGTTL